MFVGLSVMAASITSSNLIVIGQLELSGGVGAPVNLSTSTAGSLANTYGSVLGSNIEGYGDISMGQIGNLLTATTSTNRQENYIFDSLTFTTGTAQPVEVSYSFRLDGLMSNSSISGFNGAHMRAGVVIYDITGMGTWIEKFEGDSTTVDFYTSLAPIVSTTQIDFSIGTSLWVSAFTDSDDLSVTNISGSAHLFDLTKGGSFIADPTKDYGIELFMFFCA